MHRTRSGFGYFREDEEKKDSEGHGESNKMFRAGIRRPWRKDEEKRRECRNKAEIGNQSQGREQAGKVTETMRAMGGNKERG